MERSTDGKCNTSAGSIPERVNTSDGGPNDWLYVDRVPAFGDPPTAEDYERLLAGFDVVYTLRCTRPAPDGTPDIVNILHVSPVEQYGYDRFVCESEIVEIEKFMVSRGFKIEKIDGPSGWGSADVLILGTDKNHMHDMVERLKTLVRGAGLVQGWNVLVYGLDGKPTLDVGQYGRPLLTNQNFGHDGVCMMHAHLRLRDDDTFWIGHVAYMSDLIDSWIADIVKASPHKKAVDGYNMSDKIDVLAGLFSDAELSEQDVGLFSHAAHLVRIVRNEHVHFAANMERSNDKVGPALEEFNELVERYGRDDMLFGFSTSGNTGGMFGRHTPFFVSLAFVVCDWLIKVRVCCR